MEKNIVNKIEGAKIWNYVAIGSGLIFVGGAIWMVKEIYEAKQAAKNKSLALAELEKATALAGESTGENFSGCGGCSGASGVKTHEKPTELVSNASGRTASKFYTGSTYRDTGVPCNSGDLGSGTWHVNGGNKKCVASSTIR